MVGRRVASIVHALVCLVGPSTVLGVGCTSSSDSPSGSATLDGSFIDSPGLVDSDRLDSAVLDTSSPNTDDDGDGLTEAQGDCNDSNAEIRPGKVEVCGDGVDNNCDGFTDKSQPDADGDGWGPCLGDCDDSNGGVHPTATEIAGNLVDDNCDGIVDDDLDGDGVQTTGGDCDDSNPNIRPGLPELCFDGLDNDCNGLIDSAEADSDGDGVGLCAGDCDDTNSAVRPGIPEVPSDGIDNNCDFLVDEDIDGDGWTLANGDCDDSKAEINPSIFEACGDGVDNNCDGLIDLKCMGPCELAELLRSSVGCVYYAVDMNNCPIEGYDSQPFAVAVSNINPVEQATVDVQVRSGQSWQSLGVTVVGPLALQQINLPDRHIDYTGYREAGAYRIVSSRPVIAYQFQPINGETSYTSDASLLLPTSSLDRFHKIVGWGAVYRSDSQMVIVATQDDTEVKITPKVGTKAGGNGGYYIPGLSANQVYTHPRRMAAGDFMQVEALDSLNGTYVETSKPVAVFTGSWCANIPSGCCCDHLEEQQIGLQTWGKTYVAARFPPRNRSTPESLVWHVVASEDDTVVSFRAAPGVTGLPGAPQTLASGQALQLQVQGPVANPGDFLVTGSKPIMVMQYLTSSTNTGVAAADAGDPAMAQMVPVEQFLSEYVFLIPSNWVHDHVVITKRVGSSLVVDGTIVPQAGFLPLSDGVNPVEWEVGRLPLADGVHTAKGDQPFGVLVLGYDAYDSYAYPAGLNQQIINPIN